MNRLSPQLVVIFLLSRSLPACGEPGSDGKGKSQPDPLDTSSQPAQGEGSNDGDRGGEPGEAASPRRDAGAAVADGVRGRDAAAAARDASASSLDAAPDDASAPSATDASASEASASPARDAGPRSDASLGSEPSRDTVVTSTIVVKAGQQFDGAGTRFVAGPALGSGDQSEGQKPVFKLEPGASLRNVTLGSPAADGIHTYGDARLDNIVWEDIGEDALTIKESGEVVLRGGSAVDGSDKVFQINAPSTFRVSQFRAQNAGKFIRQNGGTTFEVKVFIEDCDISQMKEAIFRTDSASSTVEMLDTRYSEIGKELFIGVAAGNVTERGNVEY
jgi:pectate lyase C